MRPRVETDRLAMPRIGRVRTDTRWHIPPHLHRHHHQTIIVLEGEIRVAMGGQVYTGRAGSVLFYPQNIAHEEWGRPEPGGLFQTLFIGWDQTSLGLRDQRWPALAFDADGRVKWLAAWMEGLSRQSGPEVRRMMQSVMRTLACQHARLKPTADAAVDPIQLATGYLHEHLRERLRLDDLANAAGLSRFHFSRLFHEATGTTPMRYLAESRVTAAKHLLRMTTLPHRVIARQVGFSDEYQFSRIYRRITGHPPGADRP